MIKAQIVDNTKDGLTMAKILDSTILNSTKMDVSTGYFSVGGYGLLRSSLERSGMGVRLLLGQETMIPDDHSFESYARLHGFHADAASTLTTKSDLGESDLTLQTLEDTASLLRLLQRDDVLVRMGKQRFNHSKCYILGETAVFIGSSNFTKGGLIGNYELNSVRYDPNPIRDTQDWFDRMWNDAEDAKDKLVSILEQSKFGVPPNPYDVYIKMLFERYKHRFDADPEDEAPASHLTRFQREAVSHCMAIMSEFDGALVADATGLGKTEIALEIMRRKAFRDNRKKILLVAPSQVLKGMWDAKLKDVDINVQYKLTMEELGRDSILDRLSEYRGVDMVVIDESHNFRSKNANRRKNLMKLLAQGHRKQHVLLLSATPVNNSLLDLYYQLSIITRGHNARFYKTIGIPDLYTHMRDASHRDSLPQGLAKIEQLLACVMVRRTRSYIKDVYPDEEIKGEKIRFPQHSYSPIRYNMSGLFGDVFETLYDGLSSLTMAPYGLEQYNTTLDEDEKRKHGVLAHLQSILLLKRFESSKEAARISLENKMRLYKYVRRSLERGKILRVGEFNRIAAKWTDAELGGDCDLDVDEIDGSDFIRQIESVALEDLTDNYDVASMTRDIDADLEILQRLLGEVNRITMDTKLDEVTKTILGDMNSKGIRKAIIFTEYTATANYIMEHLPAKLNKTVACITGRTDKTARTRYIRRFSPKANLPENAVLDEEEIDVLISTEVLSEGQNLQDCNYVINYDLPWNPMRIVQRIGRVDRLASEHDAIYSRACYPDSKLDDLLKLMGKLIDKINLVDKLGLLDTELLDKVPTPKQFDGGIASRIRTLATDEGSQSVFESIERESDMVSGTSPFNELNRYMKKQSVEHMKQIPVGRRSGKLGEEQKVVLMYTESTTNWAHFVIYDYKDGRARIPVEDEAIRLVSCNEDEQKHLPMDGLDWQESFRQLLSIDAKAREAVLTKISDPLGGAEMHGARSFDIHTKNTNDMTEILIQDSEAISEETAGAVLRILESDDIRAYDDDIKNLISEYRRTNDMTALVDGMQHIGKQLGVKETAAQNKTALSSQDLVLVGAMFVTGDRFDHDLAPKMHLTS